MTEGNGSGGKLVQALAQEFRAGAPAAVKGRFAAGFGDRGNAAVAAELCCVGETRAVGAESGGQARSHGLPRAGNRPEDGGVRVLIKEIGDILVVLREERQEHLQLGREDPDSQGGGLYHGGILCHSSCRGQLAKCLLDAVHAAAFFRDEKPADRCGPGALHG